MIVIHPTLTSNPAACRQLELRTGRTAVVRNASRVELAPNTVVHGVFKPRINPVAHSTSGNNPSAA